MTYLFIESRQIKNGPDAGFAHIFNNFVNIIISCYIKNLDLISPYFGFGGDFNGSGSIRTLTNFSEYIDLDNIYINNRKINILSKPDKNIKIQKIKLNNLEQCQVRWHPWFFLDKKYEIIMINKYLKTSVDVFQYHNMHNMVNYENKNVDINKYKIPQFEPEKLYIDIKYSKRVIEIGEKITELLGNNYLCIHNRRGDHVDILEEDFNKFTEKENLIKKIAKYNLEKTYIMSHPYKKIKWKQENVYFCEDFDILNNIEDNNLLYCVESYIMEKAKIKISTFRHWSNIYSDRKYYDDYLVEIDNSKKNEISFPYIHYN